MSFVIFDTEYIADKGLYEEGFCGWQNREIIQIAAIKVSENLSVEDKLNFYIKPLKHSSIPEYFVKVTGITDENVKKNGVDFVTAYNEFVRFSSGLNCYSHGWGGELYDRCDGEVLEETLGYYIPSIVSKLKYFNIAPWFKQQYIKNGLNIPKQASGEIATLLGLEDSLKALGLNPHNAYYDIYSILEGLKYFGFRESDLDL